MQPGETITKFLTRFTETLNELLILDPTFPEATFGSTLLNALPELAFTSFKDGVLLKDNAPTLDWLKSRLLQAEANQALSDAMGVKVENAFFGYIVPTRQKALRDPKKNKLSCWDCLTPGHKRGDAACKKPGANLAKKPPPKKAPNPALTVAEAAQDPYNFAPQYFLAEVVEEEEEVIAATYLAEVQEEEDETEVETPETHNVEVLNVESVPDCEFILDSGATHHMSFDKNLFTKMESITCSDNCSDWRWKIDQG